VSQVSKQRTSPRDAEVGDVDGDEDDVVFVFEPHMVRMPPLGPYVASLWERRRFIRTLARAQIRGKNVNTFAGQFWALLDPLFQASIYWFLFTIVRGGGERSGAERMTLLVGSIFLFNFTRVSLSEGAKSVVAGKGLMLNSAFPRALLPIVSVYKGMAALPPCLLVYLAVHLGTGQPIGQGITLFPLLFVLHMAMNLGSALMLATLNVYVRDTERFVGYLIRILFFTTPVIYPLDLLTPTMRQYLAINPFYNLFAAYQEIMMGNVPTTGMVAGSLFWAAAFLVVGARVFLSHERSFSLRI
jgi:ABC-type polysaccharide/polyol phosphate export permease